MSMSIIPNDFSTTLSFYILTPVIQYSLYRLRSYTKVYKLYIDNVECRCRHNRGRRKIDILFGLYRYTYRGRRTHTIHVDINIYKYMNTYMYADRRTHKEKRNSLNTLSLKRLHCISEKVMLFK